jgi:hypothetical protein
LRKQGAWVQEIAVLELGRYLYFGIPRAGTKVEPMMPEVAHNLDQEYWRPPEPQAVTAVRSQAELCERCGTEYVLGARFCYVCGGERGIEEPTGTPGLVRWLDIRVIAHGLGLSVGSLIAFFVGVVCVAAAAVTGFLYSSTTLADWQAVQLWRIEWLLAGIAALLVGILLKS